MSVVPLKKADSKKEFGGKAANLSTLLNRSIPVPDGLAVSVYGFNSEGQLLKSSQQAIKKWLGTQKHTSFAVRSSALGEDGKQTSWAGQFDTYLNVEQRDVVDKIIECHNAETERSKAYGSGKSTKIAVVIQPMINPDYAGVLFTKNPIDGSSQMIIEYMPGLADQLVSGEVTPKSCTWDIERDTLEADEEPPFDIGKLVKLAYKIESIFSSPQDIEWTYVGNEFVVVQSRPITTLGPA